MNRAILALFLSGLSTLVYGASLVEVKVGYFSFTDSTMRQVYDDGGVELQLAASHPLCKIPHLDSIPDCLHLYGSIGFVEREGYSLGEHQKSKIQLFPISLGIQPRFALNESTDFYCTLGPRYFIARAHNDSDYVPRDMHASGLGAFVNAGFLFQLEKISLDLYGEYSYKKIRFGSDDPNFQTPKTQIGGFSLGIGLGYQL